MPRLVLLTGKGGVGKTTTAAATALHAAGQGRKVLVVSVDPAHSLGDVLGVSLGPEPVEVGAGLWALQADPALTVARAWAPVRELAQDALEELGVDPLAAEDLTGLPGLDDVFALLCVRDQVRDGPWDLVVVDCSPSAQAFRLLSAPDVLGRLLERLLPMERRIGRLLDEGRAADPLVAAVDRLSSELATVGTMLADPLASVRLVLTPEAAVLAGTRRLYTALTMGGFAVDAVVVNRVMPTVGAQWETFVREPATTSAIDWLRERERSQGAALAEIAESFAPTPVLQAVDVAGEPRGVERLSDLGAEIYGTDVVEPPAEVPAFEVEHTAGSFTLRLRMPFAQRSGLDLGRRGDDLVVTVDGYRRVISLPSVLRRCEVSGARLRDGVLAVEFMPDPAEFPSRWL
ncbi:ArsA family ATPase [Kineosporia babensis]|uniref:ArsA family ATPase n=1 Tax=Kineosporia babensis TaxID=499548 RepID=A0A9X1NED0_9ACTN|nr:ArsA family ATPase [Kineosporia babensis]MCD5311523.1 ArsA family ATPase [Kineosporia babensis]